MRSRTLVLAMALVSSLAFAQGVVSARPLTFEERVGAQEAIERVSYSRQIGATVPFEVAVPRAVLERKVRTSLEQSAALESLWKTKVTAGMLRRELERMVEQTEMPDRLRELFAALGNDPFLIEECLARPVLVDRLTRNFFAYDQTIHRAARQQAEALRQALLQGRLDPRTAHPRRSVREWQRADDPQAFERERARIPEDVAIGPIDEQRDAFLVRLALERSNDSLRVAIYSAAKETWDDWWARSRDDFDRFPAEAVAQDEDPDAAGLIASPKIQAPAGCTDDTWDAGGLDEIPDRDAPRIWTGSVMVVWGGSPSDNKGWRYDPVTDTWSPMSRTNAPGGRSGHAAVWTGSQMIVWGGSGGNSGGRYDPVADTWTSLSTLDAPSSRNNPVAVWTGSRMVIWGGTDSFGTPIWNGGHYDPATNTWSTISTANAPPLRSFYTAASAGGRMVLWGGQDNSGALNTGARYDPITDKWAPTSTTNAPSARTDAGSTSIGARIFVWGGGRH
ncbi:MAG TPA: hypothetical protein VFQ07_12030, partial [Candidatus Polarisedimenticolia bacterium]|nr:hypothetical protein [Candidatus Polarisedimenticolia bacterium]